VKKNGAWVEADWQEALHAVAEGLNGVKQAHGAAKIATLASPSATLEELYLLNKLTRALGSTNIDTRLRHRDPITAKSANWLGMKIADISGLQSVLLVGSTLRKEQPLLSTRFRAAAKRGAEINVVHATDADLLMRVANKSIATAESLATALGAVLKALAELKGGALPGEVSGAIANITVTSDARAIAASLAGKEKTGVFLGHYAQQHPRATALHVFAQEIARLAGGAFGVLSPAANSVGAGVVGADSALSLDAKGYVLLNVEPEADCAASDQVLASLAAADFVVAMSMFKNAQALQYANVILPIAPFTETAGTFVNMEGTPQSFNGVVKPLGETRPAWKVIRVLGNLLGLAGFDQENIEQIRAEIAPDLAAYVAGRLGNQLSGVKIDLSGNPGSATMREVGIYDVDAITRRAPSLQQTADAKVSHNGTQHQVEAAAD